MIKFRLIEFVFPILYGENQATEQIENVKKVLQTLYSQYMKFLSLENTSNVQTHTSESSKFIIPQI